MCVLCVRNYVPFVPFVKKTGPDLSEMCDGWNGGVEVKRMRFGVVWCVV